MGLQQVFAASSPSQFPLPERCALSLLVRFNKNLNASTSLSLFMSLRSVEACIAMPAVPSVVHLAIIEANFQFTKACPFCKRKYCFISLGTCEAARSEASQPGLMTSARSQPLITI